SHRGEALHHRYKNRPSGEAINLLRRPASTSVSVHQAQVLTAITCRNRDGSRTTSGSAMGPPKSCTTRVTSPKSNVWSSVCKRSVWCFGRYGAFGGLSDRPKPRWSTAKQRNLERK